MSSEDNPNGRPNATARTYLRLCRSEKAETPQAPETPSIEMLFGSTASIPADELEYLRAMFERVTQDIERLGQYGREWDSLMRRATLRVVKPPGESPE